MHLQKLDTTQRKMLRSMVGWIRVDGEDWADTMRRMNTRVEYANSLYPVKLWSEDCLVRQFKMASKVASSPDAWPARVHAWNPTDDWFKNFATKPSRKKGRPPKRWGDDLAKFTENVFASSSWAEFAKQKRNWFAHMQAFVQFCKSQ